MNRNKYEIEANVLDVLNKGKSLYDVFDPKGFGGYSSDYKEYFDGLVSRGYIDENTRKPTKTGYLLLQAYKQLKRFLMNKKVKESVILDETVENLSLNLVKGIERYKVSEDIYAEILIKAKSELPISMMLIIRSYDALKKKYLPTLINAGLLECKKKSKYKTTNLGLEYIKWYLYFALFAMGGTNEDKWQID
jgi:predicted transcriptional regulator